MPIRGRAKHAGTAPQANTQFASADPNSAEVQGLKSAAIPLLMSFNSEQKDEVRNLAHVMGLDQLAIAVLSLIRKSGSRFSEKIMLH